MLIGIGEWRFDLSEDSSPNQEVPPTPASPIASYYRFPPPSNKWMYYDGERWVGPARTLPWYKRPVSWARGRTPAGVVVGIGVAMALVVVVNWIVTILR